MVGGVQVTTHGAQMLTGHHGLLPRDVAAVHDGTLGTEASAVGCHEDGILTTIRPTPTYAGIDKNVRPQTERSRYSGSAASHLAPEPVLHIAIKARKKVVSYVLDTGLRATERSPWSVGRQR